MKKLLISLSLLVFAHAALAQADHKAIQAPIIGFFNGLSLIDADTLKHYTSGDFQLLEDGEIWTLDTLINRVMPRKNAGINRVNRFEFIRTTRQGNMAWVSYWNTALFSKGDKQQTVRWMESAVLIKEKGDWKIQMLHSTPLKK
jgi:type IV secretory pathway TrbF-like protein